MGRPRCCSLERPQTSRQCWSALVDARPPKPTQVWPSLCQIWITSVAVGPTSVNSASRFRAQITRCPSGRFRAQGRRCRSMLPTQSANLPRSQASSTDLGPILADFGQTCAISTGFAPISPCTPSICTALLPERSLGDTCALPHRTRPPSDREVARACAGSSGAGSGERACHRHRIAFAVDSRRMRIGPMTPALLGPNSAKWPATRDCRWPHGTTAAPVPPKEAVAQAPGCGRCAQVGSKAPRLWRYRIRGTSGVAMPSLLCIAIVLVKQSPAAFGESQTKSESGTDLA